MERTVDRRSAHLLLSEEPCRPVSQAPGHTPTVVSTQGQLSLVLELRPWILQAKALWCQWPLLACVNAPHLFLLKYATLSLCLPPTIQQRGKGRVPARARAGQGC